MEYYLKRDEGGLLEVYDIPESEVTPENEVMSAGHLVADLLSMKDAVGRIGRTFH